MSSLFTQAQAISDANASLMQQGSGAFAGNLAQQLSGNFQEQNQAAIWG